MVSSLPFEKGKMHFFLNGLAIFLRVHALHGVMPDMPSELSHYIDTTVTKGVLKLK
jgi:hypothetical protein